MQIKLKGLNIRTCMHTGNMHLNYHYPIKKEFFNVFKAAEELLKMNVIEIAKTIKSKEVRKCYCHLSFHGNSVDVIPNFRKAQTELMLISRKAKLERMIQEISDLEGLKQNYETNT